MEQTGRVVLLVVTLACFSALVGSVAAGTAAASTAAPTDHDAPDREGGGGNSSTSTALGEYSSEESIYSNDSNGDRGPPEQANATAPGAGVDQGGGDADADGGGLFGVSLSPSEWIMAAMHGLSDRALEEFTAAIDAINYAFVGLPAPGEISSPESWHSPDEGWWPGVYHAMHVAQALGIIWLSFQLAVSFAYSSAKKRRASWKRQGVAWVMVLGTTLFAPLGLHLFGDLAASIVPEGEAFIASLGNFSQFGMGVLLGTILMAVATTTVALAILAIVAVYVLAHVVVLFWPLMWAAWASHGQARSYGSTGIYLYGTVCAISVIQAFFLLAMFHIDWMASPLGPLGAVVGLVAGLLFSLVYFPILLLKQAHIAGAVGLGVAAANNAGDALDDGKTAAVEKVEQRYRDTWKGTSSGSGGGQSRPSDVGGVASAGVAGSAASSSPSTSARGHTAQRSSEPAGSFGGARHSAGTVQRRGFSSRFQHGDARDRVDYSHNPHNRNNR